MGALPVMPETAAGWVVELRRESFYLRRTDDALTADATGFGFPESAVGPLRAALAVVETSEPVRNHPATDPSPLPWGVMIDGGRTYLLGPIITFGLTAPARSGHSGWQPVGSIEIRYRDLPRLLNILDKLS